MFGPMVRLAPLSRSHETPARDLLGRALPFDRIDVVLAEKLFGSDGARSGRATGAFDGERLVGVMASAERFVKILAVDASHRRRGIATQLLQAEFAAHSDWVLRAGDHPGNYLSPGVDARYTDGLAFLLARGFVEKERVENLRATIDGNPLVTEARSAALVTQAAQRGYRVGRPEGAALAKVFAMVSAQFAAVWAAEAEHAAQGPRQALFAAFDALDQPIAFAAADGNNQGLGWFGPAGTLPAHRGKQLGEALLLQCLLAVRGLPEAGVIAWVGPKPFYERAIGAGSDRQFVQLRRDPG